MKKLFFVVLFFVIVSASFSQNYSRDIVYLKNGSIIKGNLTEEIVNEKIKIEISDGSIFVYQMDDVDKIVKEIVDENIVTETVYLKNGSLIKGVVLEQIPQGNIKIQTRDGSVFIYQMAEVENIVREGICENLKMISDKNFMQDTIYYAADYQGEDLPFFCQKKVKVPGKKRLKTRYCGGNMVFTEKEFYKYLEMNCEEAYSHVRAGRTFLVLQIVFLPTVVLSLVFGIIGISQSERVLPTYNSSCAVRKSMSQLRIDNKDFKYQNLSIDISPYLED